ncbi:MAG: DPP IV N-terminal domain-containing protein, partial [Planctomycetota bacterium]
MVVPSSFARLLGALLVLSTLAGADDSILLADRPTISPDGATIAFHWRGDIWMASAGGGVAKRLTTHPAVEETAHFSRDGKRIAFVSHRTGTRQAFEIALDGGSLKQRTVHSEGAWVQDWFPGSDDLLILSPRDHYWFRAHRPYRRPAGTAKASELLFDAQLRYARLSPDGKKVAIIREGVATWRKGYRGARASQIWIHDLETKAFTRLSKGPHEERWPMWAPDGQTLYFVSEEDGTANLWSMNLAGGDRKQLTRFKDDGPAYPRIAVDSGSIVFRRLFHLYRFDPRSGEEPQRIELRHGGAPFQTVLRENLSKASQVAFTKDGREIAFAAGGDIWVMDAELKEPVRVTNTPEEERDPVFSPDFETLVFVSDEGGQPDLYAVKRADDKRYWWRNDTFVKTRLTE